MERYKVYAATMALVILLWESSAIAKTGTLLEPTGPYAIGRLVFHWQDDSRAEVLSSKAGDKREVGVWIWYPATANSGEQIAPYIDQLDALAKALSSQEVSLARAVKTHAVLGATLSKTPERFPVVILSPGAGSLPALYTSFCEDLASNGYVVAALDHPYDNAAVRLSDGRLAKQAKEPSGEALLRYQRERVRVRVDDVRFVLNQFARIQNRDLDAPFGARLDLSRIGVFGHSRGGMTAAEACMEDLRVKVCANLDGVVSAMPAYDEAGHGPRQPFLFIEKPLPSMKGEKPEDAKQRLAFLRERGNAMLAGVQVGHSYRITITGATHATFSDEEIVSDANAARPRQLLDLTRRYLLAFFDEALNGASGPILSNAPSDAAVQIQVFSPR